MSRREEILREAGGRLCGHRGMAGPNCCILVTGHEGKHSYGEPPRGIEGALADRIVELEEKLSTAGGGPDAQGQPKTGAAATRPDDPARQPDLVERLECERDEAREYAEEMEVLFLTEIERLRARCEALERDRERLLRIGKILPMMLDAMEWGALKGALLEDGDLRAAIDAARAQEEKK